MNALRRIVDQLLGRAGYQLNRFNRAQIIPSNIPDADLYAGPEDFSRLFRPWLAAEYDRRFTPEVLQNTMLSRQKLYFLLQLFQCALRLDGDVFEAGVGSGGSARLMLECLRANRTGKQLWLLDTFEGYQKVDADRDGAHVALNQCKCKTRAEVERMLDDRAGQVHLIAGLIPGTLESVKANALCFAHIDVNLYEPTLAATEFALGRLVAGGIILFDDYNWPATYGARRAIDEACARFKRDVICVPESTQAFLIN